MMSDNSGNGKAIACSLKAEAKDIAPSPKESPTSFMAPCSATNGGITPKSNASPTGEGIHPIVIQITPLTKETDRNRDAATIIHPIGPEPIPLLREIQEPLPFPVKALGLAHQTVLAIGHKTKAPIAIAAQSVLATIALAAQGLRDVQTLGGTSPLSLFFLTVAESGERKSACDRLATLAIAEQENELYESYPTALQDYELKHARHEDRKRAVVRAMSDKDAAIEVETHDLPLPPSKPTRPEMRLSDVTYEGILKHFEDGQPSIGVFSDEGGQVIGGHAMNADNRLKTASGLSKLWDASPVNRTRAGSSIETFHGRRVSLHLMIQPQIAKSVLSDQTLRDQGLLSRTLIAWPDSTIGSRAITGNEWEAYTFHQADNILRFFAKRITLLLSMPRLTQEGRPRELKPEALVCEDDAWQLLISFANAVEAAQAKGEAFENIRGFASKAAEQAARLAGILTLLMSPFATRIKPETMANAIELMKWYLNEALRLLDSGEVPPDVYQAELLRCWLQERWKEPFIDVRSVVRHGPGAIRNTKLVHSLFWLLERNHWLQRANNKTKVGGKTVGKAWKVTRQ